MKTVITLTALLLAAKAGADCSAIDWQPSAAEAPAAIEAQAPDAGQTAVVDGERRRAYLECLQPAPFVQEPIVIEIEDIADEFNRPQAQFLQRVDAVAVN
jgi:hypothetical protein